MPWFISLSRMMKRGTRSTLFPSLVSKSLLRSDERAGERKDTEKGKENQGKHRTLGLSQEFVSSLDVFHSLVHSSVLQSRELSLPRLTLIGYAYNLSLFHVPRNLRREKVDGAGKKNSKERHLSRGIACRIKCCFFPRTYWSPTRPYASMQVLRNK